MSLVSTPALAGVTAVALASVLVALLLWRRVAHPGVRSWVGRVGLLLLVQVTGVATLAAFVNAQFDFYPHWSDLVGVKPAAVAAQPVSVPTPQVAVVGRRRVGSQRHGAVRAVRVGRLPVALSLPAHDWLARAARSVRPTPTPWGTVEIAPYYARAHTPGEVLQARLLGRASGLSDPGVLIWLPPQYLQARYARYRFPVVYAIGGYPGNQGPRFFSDTDIASLEMTAVAQHEISPFVAVLTTPTLDPPRDTECANVPGGPQVQTFLARDLVTDMEHLGRVLPPGHGWAVLGYSTGGYCATLLALRYPKAFPTAMSLAGNYNAVTDFATGDLDGGSALHKDQRDPIWLVSHRPRPAVAMLLTAATGDRESVSDLRAFVPHVGPPMDVAQIITPGGGHNWQTWSVQLVTGLGWLGRHLRPLVRVPVRAASNVVVAQRPATW